MEIIAPKEELISRWFPKPQEPVWISNSTLSEHKGSACNPNKMRRVSIDQPARKDIQNDFNTFNTPFSRLLVHSISDNQQCDSPKTINLELRDANNSIVKIILSNLDDVMPSDVEFGVADNTKLMYLNSPNLLENLRTRFLTSFSSPKLANNIYTFTGSLLIAINPHSPLDIYNERWIAKFIKKPLQSSLPHPFSFAEHVYRRMLTEKLSQTIIISGESGAGKTETAKHVLKYLTVVSDPKALDNRLIPQNNIISHTIPILEAFGNALTTHNDNSSRFGKANRIHLDSQGTYLYSSINTYLLAKSRVAKIPPSEQNYHIFYSLCNSKDPFELEDLALGGAHRFRYLQADENTYEYKTFFKLETIRMAFSSLKISLTTQDSIFTVLAAILHLGNIQFIEDSEGNAFIPHNNSLEICSRLLGLSNSEPLQRVLTSRQICDVRKSFKASEAFYTANTLAKALYASLFDYIVHLINESLKDNPTEQKTSSTASTINILDIFGFENMKPKYNNGFEQLCINYANEELQALFIKHFIVSEDLIYEREGIPWKPTKVNDNSDICDIIRGSRHHVGIMAILDEASRWSFATSNPDENFCHKIHTKLRSCENNKALKPQRIHTKQTFTLKHYPGEVEYTAEGFVDRNTDFLTSELLEFFNKCSPFTKLLLEYGKEANERRSLGILFAKNLHSLIKEISQTTSHYIRCIKPNVSKTRQHFDSNKVYQQLIYSGMLEAMRVMKEGYPCRIPYQELWERFSHFLPKNTQSTMKPRDFIDILMQFLGANKDDHQIGYTRAFFKFGLLEEVQKIRFLDDPHKQEKLVKSTYSFWFKKRKTRALRAIRCVILLNLTLKRSRAKRLADGAKEYYNNILLPRRKILSIERISRALKTHQIRKNFLSLKKKIICIQRSYRSYLARKQTWNLLQLRQKAAIKIQAHYRGSKIRQNYHKIISMITKIQSLYRMQKDRKIYKKNIRLIYFIQNLLSKKLESRRHKKLLLSNELETQREKHRNIAAQIIQRTWRMSSQRRHHLKLLERRQQAAIIITKHFQGWYMRSSFRALRQCVIRIQVYVRYWLKKKNKNKVAIEKLPQKNTPLRKLNFLSSDFPSPFKSKATPKHRHTVISKEISSKIPRASIQKRPKSISVFAHTLKLPTPSPKARRTSRPDYHHPRPSSQKFTPQRKVALNNKSASIQLSLNDSYALEAEETVSVGDTPILETISPQRSYLISRLSSINATDYLDNSFYFESSYENSSRKSSQQSTNQSNAKSNSYSNNSTRQQTSGRQTSDRTSTTFYNRYSTSLSSNNQGFSDSDSEYPRRKMDNGFFTNPMPSSHTPKKIRDFRESPKFNSLKPKRSVTGEISETSKFHPPKHMNTETFRPSNNSQPHSFIPGQMNHIRQSSKSRNSTNYPLIKLYKSNLSVDNFSSVSTVSRGSFIPNEFPLQRQISTEQNNLPNFSLNFKSNDSVKSFEQASRNTSNFFPIIDYNQPYYSGTRYMSNTSSMDSYYPYSDVIYPLQKYGQDFYSEVPKSISTNDKVSDQHFSHATHYSNKKSNVFCTYSDYYPSTSNQNSTSITKGSTSEVNTSEAPSGLKTIPPNTLYDISYADKAWAHNIYTYENYSASGRLPMEPYTPISHLENLTPNYGLNQNNPSFIEPTSNPQNFQSLNFNSPVGLSLINMPDFPPNVSMSYSPFSKKSPSSVLPSFDPSVKTQRKSKGITNALTSFSKPNLENNLPDPRSEPTSVKKNEKSKSASKTSDSFTRTQTLPVEIEKNLETIPLEKYSEIIPKNGEDYASFGTSQEELSSGPISPLLSAQMLMNYKDQTPLCISESIMDIIEKQRSPNNKNISNNNLDNIIESQNGSVDKQKIDPSIDSKTNMVFAQKNSISSTNSPSRKSRIPRITASQVPTLFEINKPDTLEASIKDRSSNSSNLSEFNNLSELSKINTPKEFVKSRFSRLRKTADSSDSRIPRPSDINE